ncbi:Glycine dehydrogenase (decarboxylating) [Nymphon striatum]|nr:Glycine dehydrogenase (decarboxylating) [Nymphon striatum]
MKLVGLVLEDKGVLRGHQKVTTEFGEGEITSGSFSPSLGKAIAFARIPKDATEKCQVDIRGKLLSARIVKPPFVRNGKALKKKTAALLSLLKQLLICMHPLSGEVTEVNEELDAEPELINSAPFGEGPQTEDISEMLEVIGVSSLDELADKTVPENIRVREPLNLQDSCSEREALETLRGIADKNKVNKSFIGMGYYDTIVPSVIQRNVLENPGWYTAYTPYQA